MSKSDRDITKKILVQGVHPDVRGDLVAKLFSRFGGIVYVRFLDRKTCVVEFIHGQSAVMALQLNSARNTLLSDGPLTVTIDTYKKPSKPRSASGSFVIVDPPKFNNFFIPTLPQNLRIS